MNHRAVSDALVLSILSIYFTHRFLAGEERDRMCICETWCFMYMFIIQT